MASSLSDVPISTNDSHQPIDFLTVDYSQYEPIVNEIETTLMARQLSQTPKCFDLVLKTLNLLILESKLIELTDITVLTALYSNNPIFCNLLFRIISIFRYCSGEDNSYDDASSSKTLFITQNGSVMFLHEIKFIIFHYHVIIHVFHPRTNPNIYTQITNCSDADKQSIFDDVDAILSSNVSDFRDKAADILNVFGTCKSFPNRMFSGDKNGRLVLSDRALNCLTNYTNFMQSTQPIITFHFSQLYQRSQARIDKSHVRYLLRDQRDEKGDFTPNPFFSLLNHDGSISYDDFGIPRTYPALLTLPLHYPPFNVVTVLADAETCMSNLLINAHRAMNISLRHGSLRHVYPHLWEQHWPFMLRTLQQIPHLPTDITAISQAVLDTFSRGFITTGPLNTSNPNHITLKTQVKNIFTSIHSHFPYAMNPASIDSFFAISGSSRHLDGLSRRLFSVIQRLDPLLFHTNHRSITTLPNPLRPEGQVGTVRVTSEHYNLNKDYWPYVEDQHGFTNEDTSSLTDLYFTVSTITLLSTWNRGYFRYGHDGDKLITGDLLQASEKAKFAKIAEQSLYVDPRYTVVTAHVQGTSPQMVKEYIANHPKLGVNMPKNTLPQIIFDRIPDTNFNADSNLPYFTLSIIDNFRRYITDLCAGGLEFSEAVKSRGDKFSLPFGVIRLLRHSSELLKLALAVLPARFPNYAAFYEGEHPQYREGWWVTLVIQKLVNPLKTIVPIEVLLTSTPLLWFVEYALCTTPPDLYSTVCSALMNMLFEREQSFFQSPSLAPFEIPRTLYLAINTFQYDLAAYHILQNYYSKQTLLQNQSRYCTNFPTSKKYQNPLLSAPYIVVDDINHTTLAKPFHNTKELCEKSRALSLAPFRSCFYKNNRGQLLSRDVEGASLTTVLNYLTNLFLLDNGEDPNICMALMHLCIYRNLGKLISMAIASSVPSVVSNYKPFTPEGAQAPGEIAFPIIRYLSFFRKQVFSAAEPKVLPYVTPKNIRKSLISAYIEGISDCIHGVCYVGFETNRLETIPYKTNDQPHHQLRFPTTEWSIFFGQPNPSFPKDSKSKLFDIILKEGIEQFCPFNFIINYSLHFGHIPCATSNHSENNHKVETHDEFSPVLSAYGRERLMFDFNTKEVTTNIYTTSHDREPIKEVCGQGKILAISSEWSAVVLQFCIESFIEVLLREETAEITMDLNFSLEDTEFAMNDALITPQELYHNGTISTPTLADVLTHSGTLCLPHDCTNTSADMFEDQHNSNTRALSGDKFPVFVRHEDAEKYYRNVYTLHPFRARAGWFRRNNTTQELWALYDTYHTGNLFQYSAEEDESITAIIQPRQLSKNTVRGHSNPVGITNAITALIGATVAESEEILNTVTSHPSLTCTSSIRPHLPVTPLSFENDACFDLSHIIKSINDFCINQDMTPAPIEPVTRIHCPDSSSMDSQPEQKRVQLFQPLPSQNEVTIDLTSANSFYKELSTFLTPDEVLVQFINPLNKFL